MEYRANKGWWNEYQADINKYRKDDTLSNVKGYFSIETYSDLTYIPTGRNAHRSLADIIVEHYKKAFGIHVEYRNVSDGTRRHPHTSTYLDCHVINAHKWLKQNEDGTYTITNVKSYLTTCNRMVENVCKECARNHLNADKLFNDNVRGYECGIFVAFPFGIDCERMIQQREEERRKREAERAAHRTRQYKCDELCQEKLNNIISNAKDIYDVVKSNLTTAEVEEKVFYWDSYSRHEGYRIIMQIGDVHVNINALKCKDYLSEKYWYELSDKVTVISKYEDCTGYRVAYNVLRSLILEDVQFRNILKRKMGISKHEVRYPEEVSRYVDQRKCLVVKISRK